MPGRRGAHILVVEDDSASREALCELLRDVGFRVTAATDGDEGLDVVQSSRPDLVITDVLMPRKNGLLMVAELREHARNADIPVVVVSALDQTDHRVAALDLGADDFLPKPIDPDELLARIRMHLRHAARAHRLERLSTVDDLTGVLNRRGIFEVLERERERAHRIAAPLSVLMIDVNEFKAINDKWGHVVGDHVLAAVGRGLAGIVRSADEVGRVGGDEFLVVCPDTELPAARALSRRIRSLDPMAAQTPVGAIEVGRGPHVRLAVGPATAFANETADALIARADAAMYRDKPRRAAQCG